MPDEVVAPKRYRLAIDIEANELPDILGKLSELMLDLDIGKLSRQGVSAGPGRTCIHTFTDREAR